MAVSVNKNLAASYILEDPLGRIANDGRVSNLGRVGKKGYADSRFAPNFDGVDDYGMLASRAIDPDLDIDIEWVQNSTLKADGNVIVSQCGFGVNSTQEFRLTERSDGVLELIVGGTVTSALSAAQGYERKGNYRLTLVGTALTIYKNGGVIRTASFTRGAAREPAAPTRIGARPLDSGFINFFSGLLYNIRINGVLWAMDQRNQAIQPSTPAGNNMTLVNVTSDRWQEVPQ